MVENEVFCQIQPFFVIFLCNGKNGPIWVVIGIKLQFIFVIWENFWDKNFGPKGHPWGHWGPYLGGM